ncbi:MAG: acyl carrier protein [Deltaproteobacteria bacterium]|nr:acyl carrier protein [Deltaproteobacteria bacterium]
MKTKDAIFARMREILVEVFEVEERNITLEAHLYKDLDFDSLDAVELAVKLGVETGISLQEEELRAIRTIGDAVDIVHYRMNR